MQRQLAVELTRTIRQDGGGPRDELASEPDLARWVLAHQDLLPTDLAMSFAATASALRRVVDLRAAVRVLFARAVPAAQADTGPLLPVDVAITRLNTEAARALRAPQLHWPAGELPAVRLLNAGPDPTTRLAAALAGAAIDLLGGPLREQLRACPAPRCVRYYLKEHPRQQWCTASCGNRARVARYYQRHHAG